MDLAAVHDELVDDIRYSLRYMGTAPVAELADIFDELSEQLSALGICHLLEFADSAQFRENLCRSGHGRRFFLQRSFQQRNAQDRHLALGRNMSFLHSMAAGALNLARDIASLSLTRWEATWEYEDDYCFYRILHAIALNPSFISTAEAGALLAQFEHALEGQSSTRYDATRALCWRDHGAFVSALEGFLEEEQERLDEERSSSKVLEGDVCYWAHRNVSLEALALLKFAELLGMRIDESFPLCPAPARLPFQDESYLDLFVALESTP